MTIDEILDTAEYLAERASEELEDVRTRSDAAINAIAFALSSLAFSVLANQVEDQMLNEVSRIADAITRIDQHGIVVSKS